MKTGMEPWFKFWEDVRYAIAQMRREFRAWIDYGPEARYRG
jgi:hypothetical protein